MGYIIEPKGVDLIVAPGVLTVEDTKSIRSAISEYRRTGTSQVSFHAVISDVAGEDEGKTRFEGERKNNAQ